MWCSMLFFYSYFQGARDSDIKTKMKFLVLCQLNILFIKYSSGEKKLEKEPHLLNLGQEQNTGQVEGLKTPSVLPYETIMSQTEHFVLHTQNFLDRCQPER